MDLLQASLPLMRQADHAGQSEVRTTVLLRRQPCGKGRGQPGETLRGSCGACRARLREHGLRRMTRMPRVTRMSIRGVSQPSQQSRQPRQGVRHVCCSAAAGNFVDLVDPKPDTSKA
jgi:hypothetical protein